MKVAKDYRQFAYEKLRGNWLNAVIVGFIATLLGGNVFGSGANSNLSFNQTEQDNILEFLNAVAPDMIKWVVAILGVLAGLSFIYILLFMFVGGCIRIGNAKFQLDLVENRTVEIRTLFSEFHRFKTGFGLNFLTTLYTFLWTLLFIIPGFIATFKYAMAPFVLAENPEMTASEAITASKELMKGNKFRLFCLSFSFIGWMFLVVLTLGLGNLFLIPYMEASFAAFYCDIKEKNTI